MQATVSSFESDPTSTRLETLFKLLSALDLELDIRSKGQIAKIKQLDW